MGAKDIEVCRAILARGYKLDAVFDVGGSHGSWSRNLMSVLPDATYTLFEPQAETSPAYQAQLKAHPLPANATLHAIAIGETDGTINLSVPGENYVGATTLWNKGPTSWQAYTVEQRSIDSLINEGICNTPDLIKIDIQGGELAALRGAAKTLPHVKFLMLETWLQRGYGPQTPLLHELIEFLAPLGFRPYEFVDTFRHESGEAYAIDVWFINRQHAEVPAKY